MNLNYDYRQKSGLWYIIKYVLQIFYVWENIPVVTMVQYHGRNGELRKEESMNESVLNLITPCLTERLVELYEQSGEYQELAEQENKLLEQLDSVLAKEHRELLNKYMTAVNSTYAACEKITYQQGMRDCASFLASLVVK